MEGESGQVRIGLTISGAVALGAYEGGALAALLAAVQAINEERPGAVRVDAIAGASAGSITALLAARILVAGLDPIDAMYRAWVRTPQLEKLRDGDESPLSVTGTRLESERILAAQEHLPRAQSTPVRVSIALGCLRGLDYLIGRIAGPPVSASTYLDWADWTIDGSRDVNWFMAPSGPLDTALASGAHAAAFPPYGLDRSSPEVLAAYANNGIQNFPPSEFLWYTDGGTIDNEPLGRTLDLTHEIDASAEESLGAAARLHMLITPDPARPIRGDDRWSTPDPGPSWTRTGLRALKLARSQRLYDDLRRVEKTNSRIEWVRLVERRLLAIVAGEVGDPELALTEVAATIAEQRAALVSDDDLREPETAAPDTPLGNALRKALDAATGLASKREVAVAVVSPAVLPEVADGSSSPHDLLAGEFLGHFGGFLDERLRENDFALGYRCMMAWIGEQQGLGKQGLPSSLTDVAARGAESARDTWSATTGRSWEQGLGGATLHSLSLSKRLKLYRIAWRSARIVFNQIRHGAA